MEPFKCPICEGRGSLPNNFYMQGGSGGTNNVQCRSCKGEGVLWADNTPPRYQIDENDKLQRV